MDQNPYRKTPSLEEIRKTAIPTIKGRVYRRDQTYRFIKGPIPYEWITRASRMSGTAVRVGLNLWFLSGLTKSKTVKLSNRYLNDFGLHRISKSKGLKQLQDAGLISYTGKKGSSPLVTILEASTPR